MCADLLTGLMRAQGISGHVVQGLTTSANASGARHNADVALSRLQVHAHDKGLNNHVRRAGGVASHNAGQQSGDNALQTV